MIGKLRSHLRKTRGFTLIELLIVIAIIAILVIIALVAINPIERIRDTNDDRSNSTIKQAATAITACVTKSLSINADAELEQICDSWVHLRDGVTVGGIDYPAGYVSGNVPTVLAAATSGWTVEGSGSTTTLICVWARGGHTGVTDATHPGLSYFMSANNEVNDVGSDDNSGQQTVPAAGSCPVYD